MKTPPFLVIGCPLCILAVALVYYLTFPAHQRTLFHARLIEEETPAPENRPGGRVGQILAQLDLTDEQWDKIEQIRRTVPDHAQRREQIYHLLTSEQQARLQQLRAAPPASTNSP